MKPVRTLAMGLALCLCWASHSFWPSVASAEETSALTAVQAGKKISIEYTLTLGDGVEFENNIGGKTLSFDFKILAVE